MKNIFTRLTAFFFLFALTVPGFSQNGDPGQTEKPEGDSKPLINIDELKERASGLSAGIILGEPSGISIKATGNGSMAWDAALAWSFLSHNTGLYLHSDFIYHLNGFQMNNGAFFRPYVGGGGAVHFSSDFKIAVRIPIGIAFFFSNMPIEVFVEAAPGLLLFPETSNYVAAGIGIRYRL